MWTHFYCAGTLDSSVVLSVFVASVRAVGCAGTLALAGLWLARRGLMTPQLTKGLSQLSVKLAIPALLFSSVVPGISSDVLRYAWPLLLLPAVYLLLGALIGLLMLLLARPPSNFRLGTVAACTFGNTTGIPVVVLSVLQQSLSRSVFADMADPLLFLSLMLVTLPFFQWLMGLLLLRLFSRGRHGGGRRRGGGGGGSADWGGGGERYQHHSPERYHSASCGSRSGSASLDQEIDLLRQELIGSVRGHSHSLADCMLMARQ